MSDRLNKDQEDGILSALDEALSEGPWAASTFLNLIGKKLQNIRHEFADSLDDESGQAASLDQKAKARVDKRAQLKKVYVSLYAFDGSNLDSWERILEHLPEQITSRPVYENEEDAVASIRSKANRINEAYAAIYIDPQFIMIVDKEKIAVDKLGKPLLALKSKAIQLDNLDVLVHETGNYRYVGGHLKLK